jgi:uncharacterized protein
MTMQITRVGILADTHIPKKAKHIPEELLQAFAHVDLIMHAGDIQDESTLSSLQALAPVIAVAGNVDPLAFYKTLGRKKTIRCQGFTIGLIHGDGPRGTTLQRVAKAFCDEEVDCIIFGHSHQPLVEKRDGILYINPGSPTDCRRQPHPSYAILEIGDQLRARILLIQQLGNN